MAIKDWNGFKKSGDTYIPKDATARAGLQASVSLLDDTVGWIGKNHLNSDDYNVYNAGGSNITATPYYNSDGHIEKIRLNGQTGTGSGNFTQVQFSQRGNANAIILEQKDYIFSVGNAIPTGCRLQAGYTNPSTGSYTSVLDSSSDGALFTSPTDTQKWTIQLVINAGVTLTDYDVYPMISDPEKYALSPSFEPYHESVEEILASKMSIGNIITSADDLNNITETGLYGVTTSPANAPESQSYFTLLVQKTNSGDIRQVVFKGGTNPSIYIRSYGGNPSQWYNWYKFTGTVVS